MATPRITVSTARPGAGIGDGVDAARSGAGWANLDVPVSVWPDSAAPSNLMAALACEFSDPGGLVVTTTWPGWSQPLRHGRRVIAWCHRDDVDEAEAEAAKVEAGRRGLGMVQVASKENLSVRLARLSGRVDVLICDHEVRWREGFWSAAAHALKPGGVLAVIIDTGDASAHADITRSACGAGLDYAQHIVATSASALDQAVGTAGSGIGGSGRHVRAHRDIAVFTGQAKGAADV